MCLDPGLWYRQETPSLVQFLAGGLYSSHSVDCLRHLLLYLIVLFICLPRFFHYSETQRGTLDQPRLESWCMAGLGFKVRQGWYCLPTQTFRVLPASVRHCQPRPLPETVWCDLSPAALRSSSSNTGSSPSAPQETGAGVQELHNFIPATKWPGKPQANPLCLCFYLCQGGVENSSWILSTPE
jgi:hypothetical protein